MSVGKEPVLLSHARTTLADLPPYLRITKLEQARTIADVLRKSLRAPLRADDGFSLHSHAATLQHVPAILDYLPKMSTDEATMGLGIVSALYELTTEQEVHETLQKAWSETAQRLSGLTLDALVEIK